MKKWLTFLFVCIFAIHTFAQVPKITLEHVFNGQYIPYNMGIYNPISDDDRYFYPVGSHIEGAIYNEDYSLRDRIDCIIDVPNGYKIGSVQFSGNMILPNGTKFFIVNFTKDGDAQMGDVDYAISKAYSYTQGKPLFDIASTTYYTTFSSLYVINGKVSLIVYVCDYDRETHRSITKTHVYSLGEAPSSSVMQIPQEGAKPYPIRTYDMNGRLIDMDSKGIPIIIQYSDGSAVKMIK